MIERLFTYSRWFGQIILPAFGLLYYFGYIRWGWPNGNWVLTWTIIISYVIMSILLAYLANREDGSIDIEVDESGKKRYLLSLDSDPEDLDSRAWVLFKINRLF